MKIAIFKYSGGQVGYSQVTDFGVVKHVVNGEDPISEDIIEVEEDTAKQFFNNPDAYDVDIESQTIIKKQ